MRRQQSTTTLVVVTILLLATAGTTTQVQAHSVKDFVLGKDFFLGPNNTIVTPPTACPGADHSKYCQGFNDVKKTGNDSAVSCGMIGNYTKFCFKVCNVGNHSPYCLGHVDAIRWNDRTCGGGNHTRYCIGWDDGTGQAELDQIQDNNAGGHTVFQDKCSVGHSPEYCKGYSDGYNDMEDVIKYNYKY